MSKEPSEEEMISSVFKEVYALRKNWRIYCEVFGTSKERVDEFNSACAEVSVAFEKALFEKIVMQISRLTDPAKGRKSDMVNVSLYSVIDEAKSRGQMNKTLWERWHEVQRLAAPLRNHRDKYLAHNDKEFGARLTEIAGSARKEIEDLICAMCELFAELGILLKDTTYATNPLVGSFEIQKFFLILSLGNKAWDEKFKEDAKARVTPATFKGLWYEDTEYEPLRRSIKRRSDGII